MNCIYCSMPIDGKNKSSEHVLPQWIINKLGIAKTPFSLKSVSRDFFEFSIITPVPNTFTHKICNSCNNGWLHKIDESCMELLNCFMEGTDPAQYLNLTNIEKLKTLLYKIFLNFFATGPKQFKERRINFYNSFYEKTSPPENTNLFILTPPTDKSFTITALDHWFSDFDTHKYEGDGFRFKFYLQLGKIAFILCNSGSNNTRVLYDSNYLTPLSIHPSTLSADLGLNSPCHPSVQDNIINRILFNSLVITEK